MKFEIGQGLTRIEDHRLVTGAGVYTDDIRAGEGLRVAFLRAPFAHAKLLSIDVNGAANAPGVVLVATQTDLDADNVGEIECKNVVINSDDKPMPMVTKPPMVRDINRFAGDIVAMVVADSQMHADNALDRIEVDFDPLDAVTDVYDAVAEGAPQLYPEYPSNIAFDWHKGDPDATKASFAAATQDSRKIVEVDVINGRVIVNSVETRPIIAAPGDDPDTLFVWCGTQGARSISMQIADALNMEHAAVRLRTGDVGGSFGFKIFLHPEQVLVSWAARKLGSMVRWQQPRSDGFLSDIQGRDTRTKARAVIDDSGRILAYEADVHANMGAWLSNFSTAIPTISGNSALTGTYDIPVASLRVRGVVTNTPAIDAYRGAGRPELIYALERLMDHVAAVTGISRVDVRRRNLIKADQIPYPMAVGITIDSGEMPALFETALQRADWDGFAERREAARNKGLYRGIGLGMYLEKSGDGSDGGVHISFGANGHMTVLASQQCNGQGHRMTLTQILSDKLGYDADKITVQQGDSSTMPEGTTGGARMTVLIGSAATEASGAIIDLARPLAAKKLDCAAENLIFDDGIFADKASNRSITLEDLVIAVADDETQHVLDTRQPYASDGPSYPYGCHIAEVEIDPATCKVKLDRFTCVNDFGVVINPVMLEGQIQGGIVQGIGQALYEHVVYDDQGQLLAGSLMDYTLPRADHIPMLDISMRNTPCLNNVLGVKGAGQAGAIGAPHAVISAICNALSIPHIDMPATPVSIWQAMEKYNVTGV